MKRGMGNVNLFCDDYIYHSTRREEGWERSGEGSHELGARRKGGGGRGRGPRSWGLGGAVWTGYI